jgi:dsRNA-specific ribonuclease
LAKISLGLGVFNLIHHNPSSRPESVAADAFEALVGAMQLDFKQHPHQISPAAIRFVLESFNMPVAQQPFLQESLEISPRGANRFSDARQLLLPRKRKSKHCYEPSRCGSGWSSYGRNRCTMELVE